MASARKKQDEKHLKILRELVALPSNKECFDCHQRGPTYVNMTIGSFVCTSCSGLLRGLTPPHRVKSISMASFSPEEVDMVKSRGNEYCRRIWLGLFDSNHAQDTKDEQQIKEFMVSKYEKKRYYLEPIITNKNGSVSFSPPGTQNHSRTSTPTPMMSIPESKPLNLSSQQSKPFTLNVNASNATPAANMFTPDKTEFVADFGSDPFASSTQFTSTTMPSFANFDNNPVFSTANSHYFGDMMNTNSGAPARCNTNRWSMPTAATLSTMSSSFSSPARKAVSSMGVAQPPSEDRYAALKDLDCLMKTQQTSDSPLSDWSTGTGNSWTVNASQTSAQSVFGSPQSTGFLSSGFQDSQTTVNPFSGATQSPWTVTAGINGVANSSQSSLFGVNPFQNNKQGQPVFGMANDAWSSNVGTGNYPTSHVSNGSLTGYQQTAFPSSQSMNFPTKPWHAVQISNPFVLGASPTPAGHSSNPFL